jgi:hypothetical protein
MGRGIMAIVTVGIDLAKKVFAVHGVEKTIVKDLTPRVCVFWIKYRSKFVTTTIAKALKERTCIGSRF